MLWWYSLILSINIFVHTSFVLLLYVHDIAWNKSSYLFIHNLSHQMFLNEYMRIKIKRSPQEVCCAITYLIKETNKCFYHTKYVEEKCYEKVHLPNTLLMLFACKNNRKINVTFTYYSYEYFELVNFSPKNKVILIEIRNSNIN